MNLRPRRRARFDSLRSLKAPSLSRGFTLIELLVVIAIIGVLAGLLLAAVTGAQNAMRKARVKVEIDNMMMALTEYYNEFGTYPPGGTDVGGDGFLDNNASDDLGAGKLPLNSVDPAVLQLRTILVALPMQVTAANPRGARTVGPYYTGSQVKVINGAICDVWDTPYRYLADGRKSDPSTSQYVLGRVNKRGPIIWSLGADKRQEPTNASAQTGDDNEDNNADNKVDDPKEVGDDICSWN